ncbi:MAG: preprotein translocase subunit SecG [Pseudomonadota bacterium]
MLQQIILIFHLLFAIALVALVLVQKGKGASMGASFGAGASQTVFGSQGSGGFLVKLTCGLAALFFVTSVGLTYLSTKEMKASQQVQSTQVIHTPSTPAKPAATTKNNTGSTPTLTVKPEPQKSTPAPAKKASDSVNSKPQTQTTPSKQSTTN